MTGTIYENKFFLHNHIGDATTDDGKKFDLATNFADNSPLVVYKNRTYRLSWNDICNLAEEAGLFKEDDEE